MSLDKWLPKDSKQKKNNKNIKPIEKRISLSELEQYLFEAANIIRGPIDKADYKSYIFPLLFFKRISDVYDDEFQQALKESEGDMEYATFAENHRFQIPKDHHWRDIREKVKDIGKELTKSFRDIEKANPDTLYSIFGDTQWTNKEKLPDRLLKKLIEQFSKYNLSNSFVKSDIAGQAYEFIIKKFADLSKKKAGEFYTPRNVIKLMTLILDPSENDSIYDPACGTGGMLLEAVNHIKRKNGDIRRLKIYGQEKNLTTSSIARMNLILHGLDDFKIECEDTLINPIFIDKEDKLMKFDQVIANPPFSMKKWGAKFWENDKFGRNFGVIPPPNIGDYAWVLHMIKSMNQKKGKMAVILPYGALISRTKAENEIREEIVNLDIIESIIGLSQKLFYGTPLAACILVFNYNKKEKNKIFFINASKFFWIGKNQYLLTEEHIQKIYQIYSNFSNQINYSYLATINEVVENSYDLNPLLYIKNSLLINQESLKEIYLEYKLNIENCFSLFYELSQKLNGGSIVKHENHTENS